MLRKQERQECVSRMFTSTNSTRNHTLCSTYMLSTSTPQPFLSVFVKFVSTDNHVLCSRDSRFQTGLLLRNNTDGNMMPTHVKHGTTLCKIYTLNGHLCHLLANVKNPTFFNGSDVSNTDAASVADFSTTKYQTLTTTDHGGYSVDICLSRKAMNANKTNSSTHSPMPTKIEISIGVLTLQLLKVVRLSRLSGMLWVKWHQNLLKRKTWFSLMKSKNTCQLNPISDVFGNITVNTASVLDSLNLKKLTVLPRLMLMLLPSSLAYLAHQHSTHS